MLNNTFLNFLYVNLQFKFHFRKTQSRCKILMRSQTIQTKNNNRWQMNWTVLKNNTNILKQYSFKMAFNFQYSYCLTPWGFIVRQIVFAPENGMIKAPWRVLIKLYHCEERWYRLDVKYTCWNENAHLSM